MKLSEFYERIGPLLAGGASANDAVRAALAEPPPGPGAECPSARRRFCTGSRFDGVDPVYVQLRQSVVDRLGEERWSALLDGYFRRYPLRSIEQNENGVWLASYLREGGAGPGAPAWLAELADFEWWEWRTFIAPDSPLDGEPYSGPLRLASTAELRAYGHDLIGWLEAAPQERPRDPAAKVTTVLFWRDAELAVRRANVSQQDLAVLKCVYGAFPLRVPGLSREELTALVESLRRSRILLGRPKPPPSVSS